MTLIYLILFSSLTAVNSKISIFNLRPPSLSKCLHEISERYLRSEETIWIVYGEESNYKLFDDGFLKHLIRQNLTFSSTFSDSPIISKTNFWRKTYSYIIELSNTTNLENIIIKLKYLHSWNSTANFFIITSHICNETEKALSGMVEKLWYDGIYNFIFIKPDKINTRLIEIYTWWPYKCKNSVDFSKIDLLDVCFEGKFRNNKDLFPQKVPKFFEYCHLEIGAVIWPPYVMRPTKRVPNTDEYFIEDGLEVRLLKIISSKLKLNASYIMSEKTLNWGHLFGNGTGTGLMALLRNKKIDVAIGAITPTIERVKFFEISVYYYFETFNWCVPHAVAMPSWKKILFAFTYQIWIAFFFSFFIFTLVIWKISKSDKNETIYKKYINCLQYSLALALEISIKNLPKSRLGRFVVAFWIWFSLNVAVIYETKLFSILTSSTYFKQIRTLDEILEAKFNILFPVNFQNYINKSNSFSRDVLKLSSECEDIKDCLKQVVNDRDSVICVSSAYTKYNQGNYVSNNNEPLIFCFDSDTGSFPVTILMKKGFPLKNQFDNIILRLTETGFIDRWIADIYTTKMKDVEAAKLNSTNASNLLNTERLVTAFVSLLIGLSIATVVFIGEIIYFLYDFLKEKQIVIVPKTQKI